jgi:N-acetylglucosaminyl-diphospho-decaprenol L-rhamnosyltransferase
VVVTHRSADTVSATLRALTKLPLVEVIVVDNDSPDETSHVVAAELPPNGRLVSQDNLGFGAGNNRGVAELSAPVDAVLFLNPDAELSPEDFGVLAAYLADHPSVGMVGASVWRDGSPLRSAGRSAGVLTEWARELPSAVTRWLPARPVEPAEAATGPVTYVEGACMLVRRAAFDEVAGFDDGFFLFFEELDLADRLRAGGWETHLVVEARVQHTVAASRSRTPFSGERHFAASTYRYLYKARSRRAARTWFAGVRGLWLSRQLTGRLPSEERKARVAAVRQMARALR